MEYVNDECFDVNFFCACTFKLEKVYNPQNEEDDMFEMEEERLRMREHVMNEVSCHNNTRTHGGFIMLVINDLLALAFHVFMFRWTQIKTDLCH